MEEIRMTDVYTVVIETPTETKTFEYGDLDEAISKIKEESMLYPDDCKSYVIDYYGNILNIK